MNALARMWVERELARHERRELQELAVELREKQDELRPLLEQTAERRRANMRMDGPTGFTMVTK